MRNRQGLTSDQIEMAKMCWEFITQSTPDDSGAVFLVDFSVALDVSGAHESGSKTVFIENKNLVKLGADAFPSNSAIIGCANSTMSLLACLCHELAHAQRYYMGFRRPFEGRDVCLDEAETSIHASYMPALSSSDRNHLVEDAMQRLTIWKAGEIK